MRKSNQAAAEYASLHFFYWMTNLSIYSFSSAFLLPNGFSSTEVGAVMTLGSIGSLLIEPVLADMADRSEKLTLPQMTSIVAGLFILCAGALIAVQGHHIALFVFYVLCYILQTIMHPLINEMNFRLERAGQTMNFGAARAMGSLGYSLMSAVLGILTERFGIAMIPISAITILIVILVILAMLNRYLKPEENDKTETESEPEVKQSSLAEFAKKHRRLLALTAGGTCLMFCSNACGTYLLQIMTHVGGTTKDMGFALSVGAAAEMPMMLLFERIRKRIPAGTMLKAAGIGFILKHALLLAAKNSFMVIAVQALQMVSFAVYIPAIVAYMHEHTGLEDAVKGQSLMPISSSLAGLICSISGGLMIDRLGVPAFLWTSFAMAVIGTVIIFVCAERGRS